jgi:hypothetical protein
MAARLSDTTRSQVVDESKPTLAGMPRPFPERTTGELVDAMRSTDVMPRAEQEPCFRAKKENNIKKD